MQYKVVAIDAFDETSPAIKGLGIILPRCIVDDGEMVEHLEQLSCFVSGSM